MKIKVQTQYTIFEDPDSEEVYKNTPMIKIYIKDGVISTFVWKNSREASWPIYEINELLGPAEVDQVINKMIQYPIEFRNILRSAFEFHNEESMRDKDRYYLEGFKRKKSQKELIENDAELKITFYANKDE